MAALPEQQMVTLTVNGLELQAAKGELIVEAVRRLGLEIPIFCYHPRMKPVGMCRMCLVEVGMKQPDGSVRMMPKPQTACTLAVDNNMVVLTDSESLRKDRKGILEFLLINHPLDCPICDRGGECPLQNNTLFYGPSTSRYVEVKRHLAKAFPLSKYVTLDLERCIQCGRCVRFTEEISGDSQLAFLFRGAQMQPRTYELTDFDSNFSGNVIEICPVGALTSSEYRFRARPWDLETKPAICMECSNGCNTWFDYRVRSMVRINGRTNEAINEEWTCDKGKFGQGYLNSSARLRRVMVRDGSVMREGSWAEAYGKIISAFSSGEAAGLTSGRPSNEDLFLFKGLIREVFKSPNLDHRWYLTADEYRADDVSTRIAEFENVPAILVFGGDLAVEQPILYLRIRKAWFKNGARVIYCGPRGLRSGLDDFAVARFSYDAGRELEALEEARGFFGGASLPEVVASRSVYDLANGADVVRSLRSLGGRFNLYATEANEQGALDIGVLPGGGGMSTWEVLEACRAGKMQALWLLQCDPFARFKDEKLVHEALENVEFLVVQDILKTRAYDYASVVLPCAAFSERDGSYTNLERRVQFVEQIIRPIEHEKPSWKIFSEIIMRMTDTVPPFNVREVLDLLAKEVPAFNGVNYETARNGGHQLHMNVAAGIME